MVKKYILAIMSFLLLIGTAFAGMHTSVYTSECCVKGVSTHISAKFDKNIVTIVNPVDEVKTDVVCATMTESNQQLTTCEKRGNCGCMNCEITDIHTFGGFITRFTQSFKSKFVNY